MCGNDEVGEMDNGRKINDVTGLFGYEMREWTHERNIGNSNLYK
jgi:hypothetical protein